MRICAVLHGAVQIDLIDLVSRLATAKLICSSGLRYDPRYILEREHRRSCSFSRGERLPDRTPCLDMAGRCVQTDLQGRRLILIRRVLKSCISGMQVQGRMRSELVAIGRIDSRCVVLQLVHSSLFVQM